ncbi:uncharacterized protein BDCG_00262 [Blastomyces dermatitidis ER-3]|uniref:Uncharacterized protein n=1 Tax=Ajellomyces dermatitidis (strain ER-3 / ATCC MYA-2586) TaxID=559297 RepID=A0ABP2EPD2_AJEDR|nr:uncharacterized protein BDCG_00262 [Blastomyces dermatitidis ER-3]EEQ83457.2 hypothetical protein BDCG_00262 [Blastomyces dermatitidis ER-3]
MSQNMFIVISTVLNNLIQSVKLSAVNLILSSVSAPASASAASVSPRLSSQLLTHLTERMPEKLLKKLQTLIKLLYTHEPVLQKSHQINTKINTNYEALLLQFCDAVFTVLCSHCVREEGSFTICISALNQCYEACASCHYNSTESHCSYHRINVSKKNDKVKEKKQKNEKRKKVKKKSLFKKHSAAENTEARVLKKQMISVKSVNNHDIEILTLCIENEALHKKNAALKIKFRTITSLLQATQTVLENDI